jgi:hypothetical protein
MAALRKWQLRQAKPDDLRRLARWLKLRNIDDMSQRQLVKLVYWLLTRKDKRERGLIP